jgi:hypothetical protein
MGGAPMGQPMGGAPMGQPMGGPPMGGAPAPAAGGSKMGRNIGIGCGVLLLLSCLCGIGWQACVWMAMRNAPTAIDTGPVTTGGGGAAPAAGGVCGRAVACCQAYMSAMPGAAGTVDCNIYSQAGMEAGCQSAIDGYRSGLSALGQAVPAACQ